MYTLCKILIITKLKEIGKVSYEAVYKCWHLDAVRQYRRKLQISSSVLWEASVFRSSVFYLIFVISFRLFICSVDGKRKFSKHQVLENSRGFRILSFSNLISFHHDWWYVCKETEMMPIPLVYLPENFEAGVKP